MKFEVIPDQQTPRVPEIDDTTTFLEKNRDVLIEFLDYAKSRYDAIGLAANQVSVDGERLMLRMFARKDMSIKPNMDSRTNPDDFGYDAGQNDEWKILIDPKIIEYIGIKEIRCEGCLTWKGKTIVAERSRAVKVTYFTEEEIEKTEIFKGLDAQIIQHEINHLNGVEERIEDRGFLEPKRIEVGRNEKCPCGSGKKYKYCCLILM
jgi:peptide deformylase